MSNPTSKTGTTTPRTAPPSPFFQPSTPHVVVVQQTPGGTRRPVTKDHVEEHKSGLIGTTANLMNAIVGSGIVGIPFAVKEAGFCAGIFLIVLCAIIIEKSLRLLIATAKHVHVPSYETVAEAAFGKVGFRFVAINMFIVAYGAMMSYLMIVKDSFSGMLRVAPDDLPRKCAVLLLVSLGIMVPLSSQRDMADLAKTSRLNVVIDAILVSLVAYNSPISASMKEIGGWRNLFSDVIHFETISVGLGVLSFAFVCQHSAFIIAGSLERPTVKRWRIVTGTTLSLCAILALTCGISGYAGYLQDTQGDILKNLPRDSVSANVARGMLGITMLFVYPLESFVARHVCVVLLFSGRLAHEGDDASILNRRDRRIGLTVVLYILAVIPALIFEDLGSVLAITGAVGGSCLSYIGPGLIYLGVHGGRFLELVEMSWLGSTMLPPSTTASAAEDDKPTFAAVETTPLVATKTEASKIAAEKSEPKQTASQEEWMVIRWGKTVIWYLCGFPLWCAIASAGKQGLTGHVHEMALQTPHTIRIGDVQYKRASVNRSGRVEADPEGAAVLLPPGVLRQNSLPLLASPEATQKKTTTTATTATTVDQRIGKEILQKRQALKRLPSAVEADPQENPASWLDFIVAMFFILFGAVALVAGILSVFFAPTTEEH